MTVSNQPETSAETAADRPYQVIVFVGAPGETAPPVEGVRLVDLTPAPGTTLAAPAEQHPMVAKLRDSALTPADLRSKTLVLLSPAADAAAAVAAYSVMTGFASRRVEVARNADLVAVDEIDAAFRQTPDAGRPSTADDFLQIGAPHTEIPAFPYDALTDPAIANRVRYARRCRLALHADPLEAVRTLVRVAALRARGDNDRFPTLVVGNEPAAADTDDAPTPGVDLDALRRFAHDMRRTLRFEDRSALVERVELTGRQQRLCEAAARPTAAVMTALGASTPDGNLWHCPRPERHRNGDANASMRVEDGRVRCFRCDPEKVDPVRLVADVKGCSLDEAADWLLANVAAAPSAAAAA